MASICGRLGSGTGNALKAFFTQPNNKMARVVNKTKGMDKTIKVAKSAAELTANILEQAGGAGSSAHITASQMSKGLGDARTVVALGNAFNGALPGTVQSAQSFFSHMKAASQKTQEGDEGLTADLCVSHKRRAAAAVCSIIGGITYLATFGAIRPILFVNKMLAKPFLSSQTKANMGSSVSYIMAANHAASVVGAGLAISAERADCEARCARIAREESLLEVPGEENACEKKVAGEKAKTFTRIKYALLTMLEKFLECVADVFKLVPLPITMGIRAIVAAGCTFTSAIIGLCTFCARA